MKVWYSIEYSISYGGEIVGLAYKARRMLVIRVARVTIVRGTVGFETFFHVKWKCVHVQGGIHDGLIGELVLIQLAQMVHSSRELLRDEQLCTISGRAAELVSGLFVRWRGTLDLLGEPTF